jgi:hypothetical protein
LSTVGRSAVSGEIRDDGLDLLLDLVKGHLYVLFKHELDVNTREALDRRRAEFVNTADRVDRLFDLFRDLGLDLFG